MTGAPDAHPTAAQIAKDAARDGDRPAAVDPDTRAPRRLEREATEHDVGGIFGRHEAAEHRHHARARACRGRWPEIEDSLIAVEIPLTWRVELTEQIETIEPLSLAIAVAVKGLLEREDEARGIDRLDQVPL
jgi:hypothetical protein